MILVTVEELQDDGSLKVKSLRHSADDFIIHESGGVAIREPHSTKWEAFYPRGAFIRVEKTF